MPFPQVQSGILTPAMNAPRTVATATATALNGDIIVCAGGGAAYTITLPAASGAGVVVVANQDATAGHTATVVTAEGASNKIAGAAGNTGYVIPVGGLGVAQTQIVCVSDGTNWQVISH